MKRLIYLLLFITSVSISSVQAQSKKVGSYTFKSGDVYTGELKGLPVLGFKPHGYGKTKFKNGDIYEGGYVNGKREGYGICQFSDGKRYEGEWKDDKQHGKGILLTIATKANGIWIANRDKAPCSISMAIST